MSSSSPAPSPTPLTEPELLSALAPLAALSAEARALVIGSFTRRRFRFGETVFLAGDPADAFYVVASGLARVLSTADDGSEVSLNLLRPGDGFGEAGLLESAPRSATVRAAADLELFALDGPIFRSLVNLHPEVADAFALGPRVRRLSDFLRVHSAFSVLSGPAIVAMLDRLERVEVSAGTRVLGTGEPPSGLYIVEHGRLVATEPGGRTGYLRTGDFFGERSLLLGEPISADVEAVEDCVLLALAGSEFDRLLSAHPDFRERVETRVASYRAAAPAAVPLDFADVIAPIPVGEPGAEASVSDGWVTEVRELKALPGGAAPAPLSRPPKFPLVKQLDEMDCGAACVAMVCRYFGRAVAASHIRAAVGTGVDGTSLAGLVRGGRHVGLEVEAVKASKDRAEQLPLPVIVHWDANHWVIVYAIDADRVWVADPDRGRRRISRAELEEHWSGYAALVKPTDQLAEAPLGSASADWLWAFIAPHRTKLLAALVLAFIAAGLEMLFPVLTQRVVDHVLHSHSSGRLFVLCGGMVLLLVLSLAVTVGQRRMLTRVGVDIDVASLDHITARMLDLPIAYFETRRTGDIDRRLEAVRRVRRMAVSGGIAAMTAGTQLIAAIVIMLFYSPLMGGLFVLTIPFYLGLMIYSSRRVTPTFEALEEASAKFHSRQLDAIRGIATVKTMGREDGIRRTLVENLAELGRRMFRSDFTLMAYESTAVVMTLLTEVVFLLIGGLEVVGGHLSVGGLVAFNALILLANGPLGELLGLWDQWQMSKVLLGRVQDIFDYGVEQPLADRARAVPTLAGAVSLRGVSFSAPQSPDLRILDGITVDIPAGATVGVIGRSGAGKSTLARCLAGLVSLSDGEIAYDGVGLSGLHLGDLRRRIGYVLQEPYLFDDTIAANIAFGEETIDPDRVRAAAELADAAEFVDRLALGYETRVGESGMRLSGGQVQRLAIARALYHQPPVLIFDEATSALDAESERNVRQNLGRMLQGRTAFLVAHRLSTIRDADIILVLERGRLVEQGSHEELMARGGLYAYLVGQQLS